MDNTKKTGRLKEKYFRIRDNLLWVLFWFLAVYIFVGGFFEAVFLSVLFGVFEDMPDSIYYIMDNYGYTIIGCIVLFLYCWLIRQDRYIWKSFLLPKKKPAGPDDGSADIEDIRADYYGRSKNGFKALGIGLIIGFVTNFICIVCALIHGDIFLYFESSAAQIPVMLFALLAVFIQASSEELWCRGYLYERLNVRYPIWVACLVNGVLFGVLHSFNEGASVLGIAEIAVCGVSYSLLRWYTGDLWTVMGMHTAWNYTQAFLFGLPNSGLVSEVSLFHLDASTAAANLVYDPAFGVEGALPAFIMDLAIGVIVLILASRSGRLGELKLKRDEAIDVWRQKL
ncbi:MAG: CPBP family intramembrane metalloprotease [Firmicutes bacterium]|nr:CPBP family intramembrane metalloprotease [Bacillota bacterium]